MGSFEDQRIIPKSWRPSDKMMRKKFASIPAFCRPGGFGEVIRPDPIPNSAVKRFSANGTMSQDMGE